MRVESVGVQLSDDTERYTAGLDNRHVLTRPSHLPGIDLLHFGGDGTATGGVAIVTNGSSDKVRTNQQVQRGEMQTSFVLNGQAERDSAPMRI
jgi:hypothetical protein